jgi:hypothetical protein
LKDAKVQAEALIENDDITVKAKMRADEIIRVAEANVKALKLSTFDYIDSILFNFQDKMDQMNSVYFHDMFSSLQNTFEKVNTTISDNRNEIKEMVYRTQMENND